MSGNIDSTKSAGQKKKKKENKVSVLGKVEI